MNIPQLLLSVVILLVFAATDLKAQESVNAAGGDTAGNGGTVSYTIGQVVYHTNADTNNSVAEGVQQPYAVVVIDPPEEPNEISFSIMAYPNPTTAYLTLELKELELSNLNFELYDMHGKLLQREKITENLTSIAMNKLPVATYFLKVTDGNRAIKTFKIIRKTTRQKYTAVNY
ncbi:T9SS type A sorting domain-containing protein [Mangrovibacterium lignilyticum]|uniref:T9SS type A sorting domain-containing protein n=1 Tax=Mangrovibacterium lignilyticum TaxID=2668052 RepID=UPI0013D5C46B|nr:T9SS type A sorting domain-containing protein [Mangrovibacterium lignilyticum]